MKSGGKPGSFLLSQTAGINTVVDMMVDTIAMSQNNKLGRLHLVLSQAVGKLQACDKRPWMAGGLN